MQKNFDIEVGDVLIVKGKTKSSKILSIAQKVLYWNNTSSHVLVAFSDGFYIHSTGNEGVHLISFKELLPEIEPNYKAIRLKNLDEEKIENLRKSITHYLGQPYNKMFFMEQEGTSFCSELVAKIYKYAAIEIFEGKHSSLVTPSDFEKEANLGVEWKDVTFETSQKFLEFINHGEEYDFAYLNLRNIFHLRRIAISSRKKMYNTIMQSELFSEHFRNTYDEMQKDLAPKLQALNWDDVHTNHYKEYTKKMK